MQRAERLTHGPAQTVTDMGYTGHRHNNQAANDLGLIYMNARYYLPGLARFASPDTLVPDPANPQAFNRYTYVRNSPPNLTDPTGHRECGALDYCRDLLPRFIRSRFPLAIFTGAVWFEDEKATALQAVGKVGGALAGEINMERRMLAKSGDIDEYRATTGRLAFLYVYGGAITLYRVGQSCVQYFGNTTFSCFGSSHLSRDLGDRSRCQRRSKGSPNDWRAGAWRVGKIRNRS